MRRKGFVLTLDALLSLLLVMIFVSAVAIIENNVNTYTTYMREQEKYIAEDTLTILRTVSLKELVPPQKIQEWLADGTLNTTLVSPDMSPLDIVSTYWATELIYPSANLRQKAEIILGYVLNRTLAGYNYELMINNYTSPYLRKVGSNPSEVPNIAPATLILSGYAYNQTPRGYMARLYLAQITKQDEYIYMSDAVLSYPYYSGYFRLFVFTGPYIPIFEMTPVDIGSFIELPSGEKDSAILFFMPVRYYKVELGSGWLIDLIENWINNQLSAKVKIYINSVPLYCNGKNYGDWQTVNNPIYVKAEDSVGDDTCNLLDLLNPGQKNALHFEIKHPSVFGISGISKIISIGDSGSSHLIYVYNTTKFKTYEFVHDFNFPDVETENPTQVEKAVFIPYNITSMNVRVHINVSTTTNVTLRIRVLDRIINVSRKTVSGNVTLQWSDSEIKAALNSAGLTYENLTNQYFYLILSIGLKDYEEVVSPYEYGVLYNNESSTLFLAEKFPHIGGGFHLIGNDSTVHIDYETPSYTIHTISLTRSPQVESATCPNGDEWCTDITWSWNLPNVTPVYTKFQFPYFWNKLKSTDPSQQVSIYNDELGEETLYCHGSVCTPNRGLLKVFNHWGYGIWSRANDNSIIQPTMAPGENKFILHFGQGFYISKDNSMGETLILLDSYVPYGNTFPYLLQGYPEYTGYNLTYYYEDINGNIKSDSLLIDIPYETNIKYRNITINELYPEKYALDDAIVRLFKKLGGRDKNGCSLVIPIKLESTISDVIPIQNVPSLYKPITITLRVWREG